MTIDKMFQGKAKASDERHRYGQHYTPREVARLLAAFAVRSPGDVVLDPSCGDGRLLEEALQLKNRLRAGNRGQHPSSPRDLFGVERSATAIKLARATGACVATGDFFDLEPRTRLNKSVLLPRHFDAIIGNPPYIRQEVIGARDKRRIEARLADDREACPEIFWPRWSGRSDIYVYFFAHSTPFLKEGGRLAFLTASSWLDAGYGAALRGFLLNNFRVIAVVESEVESFFADASINTCITVLERESDARAREGNSIRFIRFNRMLSQVIGGGQRTDSALGLAREIERQQVGTVNDSYRVRVIAQSALLGGVPEKAGARVPIEQGWSRYLRAADVFFRVIERGTSSLRSLSKLARVRFGVKTGANRFFYLNHASPQVKKGNGKGLLALREVASVRRGITTGANEFFYLRPTADTGPTATDDPQPHAIETRFLAPVVFSLKEIPGVLLDRVETRLMLFNCLLAPEGLAGTRALQYIESGERAGYNLRPTCSSREPWYSVGRGIEPAPLIFPSKVGERWLVALNRARVFEDKKLYGIFPAHGVSASVLAALLNSTWARYYAEVTCRQMTGAQAIADIDVSVAEQILVPDPRKLSPAMKKKLEAALAELTRRPVYSIFEEVTRTDRRKLDALTLEAIGFSEKPAREAALDQLYDAATALVRARLSKSLA